MPAIGNSDHDIVLYDTSIKAYRPKPVRRQISLWNKADSSEIRKDLRGFLASGLSTYDFSTLYTTLPHNSGGFRGGALGASAPPAESIVKKILTFLL